jgi:uncharacterized repeat protein (TIGR01451 family)
MKKIIFTLGLVFGLLISVTSFGQIVANDDVFNNMEGIMGVNSPIPWIMGPNTVLQNDLLNGNGIPYNQNSITFYQVSTTNIKVNLVTTDGGYINVEAGTPAGTYYITYQICEIANPSNCDTAVITVNVCNLPAPNISAVIQPSCSSSTGRVLLTGLPSTGTWHIMDIDVIYASGTGTSKWIENLNNWNHRFTVTSGGCTSPPVFADTGHMLVALNDTYVDFNSDGIVNVGDKINYQIPITNRSSGSCYLTNITVTSTGLNIVGGPATLGPNFSALNTFSASYTITQNDINNGYVEKSINVNATANTLSVTDFKTKRTPLNILNGIKLNAFFDNNSNGVQDLFEQNYTQGAFQHQINSGTLHNVISSSGTLNLYETNPSNLYNLTYLVNTNGNCAFASASSYSNISVALNSGITTYNFPITNLPCVDLSVHLNNFTAPPRPGFIYKNYINYKNNGNQTITNGTITFTKDATLTISSISPTGSTITSDGFTFNFTNLAPNESRQIQVSMQVPTIPTVILGQLVTNTVSITPTDNFSTNNTSNLTQTIVGSYDPNDKQESHGGKIEHSTFTSNDYLTYTIQFENTGTADAINVRVEDVLDAKLDETSVRMIAASHTYILDRVGSNLTWKFVGINLPPSVANTQIGHGYITFQVKPKVGYNVGDIIPNFAEIYFDFNPAIVTNTVITLFSRTLSSINFAFTNLSYYPNPVKNSLTFSNASLIDTVQVTTVLGQTVFSKKVNNLQTEIDMSSLINGVYFVKVTSEGQEKTVKIIKE